MKQYQALAIFCCLLSFLSIFGCSSGGGGGDGGPASGGGGTALPITSVMVAPSTVSVRVGQTQQLAAVVQGTGNFSNAVTWAVNNVAGGQCDCGDHLGHGLIHSARDCPQPQSRHGYSRECRRLH
jgi:Bacterial Ig-like domain (group 2)